MIVSGDAALLRKMADILDAHESDKLAVRVDYEHDSRDTPVYQSTVALKIEVRLPYLAQGAQELGQLFIDYARRGS